MPEETISLEKMNTVLATLRRELETLLGDRLDDVYLYGSRARGDARPDSDIDLLIVMRGEYNLRELQDQTLELVARISLEYDVVISRAFVSKQRFVHERSPFMMNVRREAVRV